MSRGEGMPESLSPNLCHGPWALSLSVHSYSMREVRQLHCAGEEAVVVQFVSSARTIDCKHAISCLSPSPGVWPKLMSMLSSHLILCCPSPASPLLPVNRPFATGPGGHTPSASASVLPKSTQADSRGSPGRDWGPGRI